MGDRERSPRRDRRSGGERGDGGSRGTPGVRKAPPERRIFISNIPFDMKWQEVKDLFRQHVGTVTYVELFNDANDKPRGCGIVELSTEEMAKKAIENMHRMDFKGRKLVVKEDFDVERDKHGRIVRTIDGGGGRGRSDRSERSRDRSMRDDHRESSRGGGGGGGPGPGPGLPLNSNTYGLSPEFLHSLGIDCPLHTRLFVANLSYSVDEKKMREVFRLAGRVVSAELNRDKEGKSRGHGVIEYTHPVEAVQAISMFNEQMLFDRKMTVRFDKQPGTTPEELDQLPNRLPEGLHSVGMGLGSGGNPLTNVAQNLPSAQNNANNMSGNGADLGGNLNLQGVAALAQQLSMVNNIQSGGGLSNNLISNLTAALTNAGASNSAGMPNNMNAPVGMNPGAGGGGMASGGVGMGGMGNMGGSGGSSMGGGVGMGSGMGPAMGSGMGPGMGPGMGSGMGSSMGSGMGSSSGYNTGGASAGYGGAGSRGAMSDGPSGMPRPAGVIGGNGVSSSGGLRGTDTILVRNLPLDCNWQSLREGFSHCGDIKYAEMKDRGTGLIRFNSERDAERAVSVMDKQVISGRTIDVRLY